MRPEGASLPLLLASTSPARRELLARLGIPFEAVAPDYEEAACPGLSGPELALRHALGKALSVAGRHPDRIAIGSDQAAELDGELLGKPGTQEAAVAQLLRMSGRRIAFHTGLALVCGGRRETAVETYWVRLRHLSPEQAAAYVARERPLGCAGSFKIEGLGISLMQALEGRDYTALIGLPLIALTELLGRFGVDVLAY
ncbi:MAG: septum formation protein Maf [Deltaproteobacteria bacterium]|nr:septum formation protein Maf [Deltaproteobacteria bacterium]